MTETRESYKGMPPFLFGFSPENPTKVKPAKLQVFAFQRMYPINATTGKAQDETMSLEPDE